MKHVDKNEPGLDEYVRQIQRHALLSREEETALASAYRLHRRPEDAHRLVTANLRFVVKVAHDYGGYGLKMVDLVQEGNLGLMTAVEKFEPERGFRLVSYAVWWIRAYMQNFIMRSWSQVKLGTTQAQRKLFFKLRSTRERADRQAGLGQTASAASLAEQMGVKEQDIIEMEQRMSGHDLSLDTPVQTESGSVAHVDVLVDPASQHIAQQEFFDDRQKHRQIRGQLACAMRHLNDKERYIIQERLMSDMPQTLQEIGHRFHISRERARQIEGNVRRKMHYALTKAGLAPTTAAA